MSRWLAAVLAMVLSVVPSWAGSPPPDPEIDPALPVYTPVQGVAGGLKSIGSETMNNTMTLWAEGFRRHYRAVTLGIEGKGSSTAPPALIEGQAQFGQMSRPMKPSEVDEFVKHFGYEPTHLRAGIDCLAVFVHKDNPIASLSLEQLRAAFSVAGPELTWADLGVTDPAYATRQVSLYGRNSASGTYGYFKDAALGGADFKDTVKEQAGSSGVIAAVGADPFGMGYSGMGRVAADVRVVPLSIDGSEAFSPSAEHALSGLYPLARFLYLYINYDPTTAIDPLRREFIRFIFSREGQEAVVKDGFIPVPADIAREELQKLGLEPGF